ncbi:glycosyltransferase [Microvirga pudoricolor]|uniref:glycosyltransferase n=1 Tax=Microvirga pudoricolor TaxID=2778729 RepID=UPI00194DFAE8|nr:glycosyltransferase [Microvirga pudoricolor]MBM6594403.1 glycosyltransferase [Microvirga pudoricolor]
MALLDAIETEHDVDHQDGPRAALLGQGVVLVVWDVAMPGLLLPSLAADNGTAVAPTASLKLPLVNGGTRLVWVLRRHVAGLSLTLSTGPKGLTSGIHLRASGDLDAASPFSLLSDTTAPGQAALLSALVGVWSNLFKLQRDPVYNRTVRALLRALASDTPMASVVARAPEDAVVLRAVLDKPGAADDQVYLVSSSGMARIRSRPHRMRGRQGSSDVFHCLAPSPLATGKDAFLAFAGQSGLRVRAVQPAQAAVHPLAQWLREHAKGAPGLREHLLAEIAAQSEAGRSAAIEIQISAPLDPQRVSGGASGLSAEVTCALATEAGTLVAGWVHDPSQLTSGLAAAGADGAMRELTPALHRYPLTVHAADRPPFAASGFVALSPADRPSGVPLLQPRFRLLMKSGAYHPLVPRRQPADPVEARAQALRAVPPQFVDERLLADVIAPVVANLHARAGAQRPAPRLIAIGTPSSRPRMSVVIPLYKVLDFLRFQIASFATDPSFRRSAELIYVLDSPDQATEVEQILRGLHLIYGLPVTLVVMARNAGYAHACNTGAAFAKGDVLALVNSDIIPTAPGWLDGLASKLDARRRIGIVGPKLLFEDGSLQHAGMYFERDHQGRWLNHHYFKGMPRHYAPATQERLVPAVTGACLVMPRSLFERVNGFTEDYVIGDYEDSDLCLKAVSLERRILYVPDVELYHLERKSMAQNADYMRGIAWQYNCALHGARWGTLITDIMKGQVRAGRPRSKAA